jgi:hypothetical protein
MLGACWQLLDDGQEMKRGALGGWQGVLLLLVVLLGARGQLVGVVWW